jgi:WD40 repeat protein
MTDPSQDLRSADPKKSTVKKILFNSYGDKMYVSNMEGSFTMHSFDREEQSYISPLYSIPKSKQIKFDDFDIVDDETIVAGITLKNKYMWLNDLLMPASSNQVMENNQVSGNILLVNRSKNSIYSFNHKPGLMTESDIRMNLKTVKSLQISSDEVTSACLDSQGSSLVIGTKDGRVKIVNLDSTWSTRENLSQAFPAIEKKKQAVTVVKTHPVTGALFAASNQGNLKLLRLRI